MCQNGFFRVTIILINVVGSTVMSIWQSYPPDVCKQLVSECCDEGVSLYYQFVPTETETSTKV